MTFFRTLGKVVQGAGGLIPGMGPVFGAAMGGMLGQYPAGLFNHPAFRPQPTPIPLAVLTRYGNMPVTVRRHPRDAHWFIYEPCNLLESA